MKVHFEDSNLALASWRNVQLQLFSGPMLLDHAAQIAQVRASICAQHPGQKVYSLVLVQHHVLLPEPAVREAASEMLRFLSKTGGGVAYAVEGTGLRASAMRTFVSVMSMAAHAPFPTQVFGDSDRAIDWLLGDAVKCRAPVDEFRSVVHALKRQHEATLHVRASA